MNLAQANYELRFENLFLRSKGNEFQTLFERLMGLAYKADFMACRPWGKQGDRKNDGFLTSERRLFQVYAPNEMEATKARLGFDDLRPVLESISRRTAPADSTVKEVPMGKIEANALSESVATLIKNGMSKAPLVERFFAQWHDESLGETVAEAFRAEYQRLRGVPLTPNEIFTELQSWSGGSRRGSPEHEMAVFTVLAYYFERCDIFEEPRPSNP